MITRAKVTHPDESTAFPFHLTIRDNQIDVRDYWGDDVAGITVHNGHAEITWRTRSATYAGKQPRWWSRLGAEVAKAVAL